MPQAARLGDVTGHGPPLAPGPGCTSVFIGYKPAWRAMPVGMADAVEGLSNAVNSFMTRPQMTPVDATIGLVQISQALASAGAAAAGCGAAAAGTAATGAVPALAAANAVLSAAWTTASAIPGGQPAATLAYTEGIKAAAALAASAVMSAMASLTDMHVCPILVPIPPHGPGFVTRGSPWVNIGGLSAARQQDQVFEACGGADPIAIGCPTVNIGDGATRRFATADEAAIAAMREANPRSVSENLEFGGWIYRNPDGTFSYDPPTRGQLAGLTNMPARGPNDVAWYHTHGAFDPAYDNENFSGATGDRGYSRANNAPGYLATPTGVIRRYDPAADPGRDNVGRTGETTLPATAPP